MYRSEIARKVKARLEEYSPFEEPDQLLADPSGDVKPLDAYIEEAIDTACNTILLSVPLSLVRHTVQDVPGIGGIAIEDGEVGVLDVPCDYLRLYRVKCSTWRRAVSVAVDESSPIYPLQRNRYTRGRTEKPVVAIAGNRFEIYSMPDGTVCTEFRYVPRCDDGCPEFEANIAEFVIEECAAVILETFSEIEKARQIRSYYMSKLKIAVQ